MQQKLDLKKNLYSLILLGGTFILYFAPRYMSMFSLLVTPFILSLIIFIGVKYQVENIIIPLSLLNFILFFFFKLEAITFMLNSSIPAVFILLFLNKNSYTLSFDLIKKIAKFIIIYSLSLSIITIILLRFTFFYNLAEQIINYINNYFDSYIAVLKKQNLSLTQIEYLRDIKKMAIKILIMYYPAVIFINYIFYLSLNAFLSAALISNYVIKKPKFIYMLFLKINDSFIWPFIISWALVFVSLYINSELFSQIIWNIALIISTIYIIQGIIILFNKLLFIKLNSILKFILIFIVIELIISFFMYSVFIILGLGLFDTWFDFRHISKIKDIDTLI